MSKSAARDISEAFKIVHVLSHWQQSEVVSKDVNEGSLSKLSRCGSAAHKAGWRDAYTIVLPRVVPRLPREYQVSIAFVRGWYLSAI